MAGHSRILSDEVPASDEACTPTLVFINQTCAGECQGSATFKLKEQQCSEIGNSSLFDCSGVAEVFVVEDLGWRSASQTYDDIIYNLSLPLYNYQSSDIPACASLNLTGLSTDACETTNINSKCIQCQCSSVPMSTFAVVARNDLVNPADYLVDMLSIDLTDGFDSSRYSVALLIFCSVLYVSLLFSFCVVRDPMWRHFVRKKGVLVRLALYNIMILYSDTSELRSPKSITKLKHITSQLEGCMADCNWKAGDKLKQLIEGGGFQLFKQISGCNLCFIGDNRIRSSIEQLASHSKKQSFMQTLYINSRVWNCWSEFEISSPNSLRFCYAAAKFFLTIMISSTPDKLDGGELQLLTFGLSYSLLWGGFISIVLTTLIPLVFSRFNLKWIFFKPPYYTKALHAIQYSFTNLLISYSIIKTHMNLMESSARGIRRCILKSSLSLLISFTVYTMVPTALVQCWNLCQQNKTRDRVVVPEVTTEVDM